MRAPPRNFARAHKAAAGYSDLPANARGAEKGFLVRRALGRVQSTRPKVVKVGPDGGAAVSFLAAQLARDPNERVTVHLTLIKAPGVVLQSLTQSSRGVQSTKPSDVRPGKVGEVSGIVFRNSYA